MSDQHDNTMLEQDDAKDAEPAAAAERSSESSVRPAGSRRVAALAGLALLLGLAGVAAGGFAWWQQRGSLALLALTDSDIKLDSQALRVVVESLQQTLAALEIQHETRGLELEELVTRIDTLPGRFAQLERRMAAAQGSLGEGRDEWLLSEAEYFLEVANAEIALAGRWETAQTALEIADGKLRELADPRFAPVRAMLADELIALRSVNLPDVEGTVFTLGRLAERAAVLPLRMTGSSEYVDEDAELDEAPTGVGRLWAGFKGALGSIVRVERREQPVAVRLSVEEGRLLRRQLAVDLQLAQIAILRGEGQVFSAGLASAGRLLEQYFDTASSDVQAAIDVLEGFAGFEISPPMPDLSGSLNRLRDLAERDD